MNLLTETNISNVVLSDDSLLGMSEDVLRNLKKSLDILQETIADTNLGPRQFFNYRLSLADDDFITIEWFFNRAAIGFILEKDDRSGWYFKSNTNEQNGLLSTLTSDTLKMLMEVSGML